MNTESDTPRTDAVAEGYWYSEMLNHAEQLERELNEMRKDLKNALDWIDDGVDQEGRDLIVDPMRAKYFSYEKLTTETK
jgi:hypothetical protein